MTIAECKHDGEGYTPPRCVEMAMNRSRASKHHIIIKTYLMLVKRDLSTPLRVVQPQQQLCDCRFARAGGAHNECQLVGREEEGDGVEDLLLLGVAFALALARGRVGKSSVVQRHLAQASLRCDLPQHPRMLMRRRSRRTRRGCTSALHKRSSLLLLLLLISIDKLKQPLQRKTPLGKKRSTSGCTSADCSSQSDMPKTWP